MPLLFIGTGLILILAGWKGDPGELLSLIEGDFSGSRETNYVYWLVAILVLGSLGYIEQLRKLSRLFVALVVIVLLLKKDTGFFAQLQAFINSSSGTTTTTK